MDTVETSKKTAGKQTLNWVEKVSLDTLLTNTTPHYTRSTGLQHTRSTDLQHTTSPHYPRSTDLQTTTSQHYTTSSDL